jgi:hypothetical protein
MDQRFPPVAFEREFEREFSAGDCSPCHRRSFALRV